MPTRRITVSFVSLVLASAGCVSASPVKLGFISTEPVALQPRIIQRDVRGSDCSWVPFSYGDYGKATDDALSKAPGSNVLANASFFKRETLWSICVEVRGDAGVL